MDKKPTKKTSRTKKPTKIKMGLGDAIKTVTSKTGVDKLVEAITDDCGCDDRLKLANKIKLPINIAAKRCFDPEQRKQFEEYRNRRTLKYWSPADVKLLVDLYAHVFALQYNIADLCINCTGSGKIIFKIDEQLELVYNETK